MLMTFADVSLLICMILLLSASRALIGLTRLFTLFFGGWRIYT